MVAIRTRFHGPTNHRGSRYTAYVTDTGPVRQLTLNSDHTLGLEDNHKRVARALVEKLGWTAEHNYGPWLMGSAAEGYVFVCHNGYESDRL